MNSSNPAGISRLTHHTYASPWYAKLYEKEGYYFLGWYLSDLSHTNYQVLDGTNTTNLLLYARFLPLKNFNQIELPDAPYHFTTINKTTTKKETVATDELLEDVVETESVEESVVEKVTSKKAEKKKYALTDGISCRSITQGGLYMHGIKSDIAYKWSNDGDVTEVEYQDLVAAVRSSVSYVMKPYFIIEDKEFVSQFPQLNKVYETMYSVRDLRSVVLDLTPNMMKSTILSA